MLPQMLGWILQLDRASMVVRCCFCANGVCGLAIQAWGMGAAARVTQLGLGVILPADGVVAALSNFAFKDFSLSRCNFELLYYPFVRGTNL